MNHPEVECCAVWDRCTLGFTLCDTRTTFQQPDGWTPEDLRALRPVASSAAGAAADATAIYWTAARGVTGAFLQVDVCDSLRKACWGQHRHASMPQASERPGGVIAHGDIVIAENDFDTVCGSGPGHRHR